MARRAVAITGIGCVASTGADREAVWNGLVAGRCGIRPVTLFDTAGYRSTLGAEVADFRPRDRFSARQRRRWSRCDQIAVLATAEALKDAGFEHDRPNPARVGVMLGAGTSDLRRNEDYLARVRAVGVRKGRPSDISRFFSNAPVDVVGEHFGFTGPRHCVVAACSSSSIAIGYAVDAVRDGVVDIALAGGADVLCRLTFSGFNALRLVDLAPCRPFDAGRAGITIGEAAAVLVLEDLDVARARGASIYAELAGHSATCEAHHPTSPEPDGRAVVSAIRAALDDAGEPPERVDHINAHGTGTVHNDRAEARAFHRVFGDRTRHIPVTSIKSMVGHCLGAAGAIEAAALAMTIARGIIPPTIHHRETDPECALDIVANESRARAVRCGVSTSLGFGGNDAALVMRHPD